MPPFKFTGWISDSSLASIRCLAKNNRVELELLTHGDLYLFFEQGIRGGVSMIMNRYSKANNKYMGDLYDPDQPSAYIQYLKNGLYGWVMSQPLAVGGFHWLTPREINTMMSDPNQIRSCTLEVDLECSQDIEFQQWGITIVHYPPVVHC